jgi:hypothetical protein
MNDTTFTVGQRFEPPPEPGRGAAVRILGGGDEGAVFVRVGLEVIRSKHPHTTADMSAYHWMDLHSGDLVTWRMISSNPLEIVALEPMPPPRLWWSQEWGVIVENPNPVNDKDTLHTARIGPRGELPPDAVLLVSSGALAAAAARCEHHTAIIDALFTARLPEPRPDDQSRAQLVECRLCPRDELAGATLWTVTGDVYEWYEQHLRGHHYPPIVSGAITPDTIERR